MTTTSDAQEGYLEFDALDEQTETLNALWYGDGGTGKTSAIASLANVGPGPLLVVNAEGGLKRRALQRRGVDTANIRVFPRQGEALTVDGLERLYWQVKGDLDDDPASWCGVAWDSITEITKKLLGAVVAESYEKDRAKAETQGMDSDRSRWFIDRSDYGDMAEQVRLLLRDFRDLPTHFLVTALERRDQDDDGEVRYGPSVTPALQNDLFTFMDVVVHTEVGTYNKVDEFRARTRPGTKYSAKDRFDVLPKVLFAPTAERILGYVNEELVKEDDPIMIEAKARRAGRQSADEQGETDGSKDEGAETTDE